MHLWIYQRKEENCTLGLSSKILLHKEFHHSDKDNKGYDSGNIINEPTLGRSGEPLLIPQHLTFLDRC